MENGAFDATTVTEGQEAASQKEQVMRHLEVGVERNRFGNAGVLKAASGNVAKRLKMRETRVTTRAGKTAEAAAKRMATQELQWDFTLRSVRVKRERKGRDCPLRSGGFARHRGITGS